MATSSQSRPYAYALAGGGFEIVNGKGVYNRPLYGPHCRDLANFDERLLAVAGDGPDALVILMNWRVPGGGGCSAAKLGHFVLGLRTATGAKWLHDAGTIKARYVPGHQDYELQDPVFPGALQLSYVRPVAFEGLLVRVRLPAEMAGAEIVFACGGATEWVGHLDYQGGKDSTKDFQPAQCEHNEVRVEGQTFAIRRPFGGHAHSLYGAASVPLQLRVADASALGKGPAELAQAAPGAQPLVAGTCAADSAGAAFFVLTPDALTLPEVQAFLADPAEVFESCCRHYQELSRTIRIETPDPYLDLGFAAQVLGLDGAWHEPCFTHGPWSWASPYAGWRVCYGPTVLGWHQRVQSSTAEFFKDQLRSPEMPAPKWQGPGGYASGHECRGAVPDLARNRSYFYNMGEVLVDHILYDWEWTGDLQFMASAFDFIADKLLWEERCLDPDGDGLYENWLNTWVSDAHWYNGSGCIQASVYNWRANRLMADVAARLGQDPAVFRQRAERTKRACEAGLWHAPTGVYAEFRDALGLQRLHLAPEQASLYHPIDFRFCDDFQSYQMLRYSEYAIRNEVGTTPRGGRLVWSSNWEPPLYSSLGLYPQETINLLLCYYRLGLAAKGDALLKGVEASFFNGLCPGGIAHNQRPDGSHFGSTDFTDTTSMFVRTVVEGLFGVQMNVPDGLVTVQPCFPREWDRAVIEAPDIACEYTWDGTRESLRVRTPQALRYRVRLMARTTRIAEVTVDGREVGPRLEPGIGCTWVVVETPVSQAAEVVVRYRRKALATLEFSPVAASGQEYRFGVKGGTPVEVRDPQGLLDDVHLSRSSGKALVRGEPGWHTFFVLTESGKARAWLPVDVELRPPLETVGATLTVENGLTTVACGLRNSSGKAVELTGGLSAGAATCGFACKLRPLHDSASPLKLAIRDPSRLSPGSNLLTVRLDGSEPGQLQTAIVDWQLAAKLPAVAAALAKARPIPLSGLPNADLATLHRQHYLEPRPKTYSIMVQENGRSIWDWNARGYCVVDPRLDRLKGTGGVFRSDIGVPFAVPESGPNVCITSLWENYPPRVTLPVGAPARKLYFLLMASTNPMQSQIENARITVHLAGGDRRVLPLVNPKDLDDWLCNPFAQSGFVQMLGEKTHGLILDLDLGQETQVENCELECLSNEVLVGLLGVTVL
jgi:hypothetical protein